MYNFGQTTKTTQDWQIEAYEHISKQNSTIRYRRLINEMECNNNYNVLPNLSKRRINT